MSSTLLPEIRRQGLSSKSYVKGWRGVFVTNDRDVAEMFVEIREDDVGGDPLVCGVLADATNLTPDMEMYKIPGYDVLDQCGCNTGNLERSEELWMLSFLWNVREIVAEA